MISIKRFYIIVIFFTLMACASKIEPVAYNCPRIELPDDPVSLTDTITDDSTPDEVMKAWVATAYAYRGWNRTVRQQVESSK